MVLGCFLQNHLAQQYVFRLFSTTKLDRRPELAVHMTTVPSEQSTGPLLKEPPPKKTVFWLQMGLAQTSSKTPWLPPKALPFTCYMHKGAHNIGPLGPDVCNLLPWKPARLCPQRSFWCTEKSTRCPEKSTWQKLTTADHWSLRKKIEYWYPKIRISKETWTENFH